MNFTIVPPQEQIFGCSCYRDKVNLYDYMVNNGIATVLGDKTENTILSVMRTAMLDDMIFLKCHHLNKSGGIVGIKILAVGLVISTVIAKYRDGDVYLGQGLMVNWKWKHTNETDIIIPVLRDKHDQMRLTTFYREFSKNVRTCIYKALTSN